MGVDRIDYIVYGWKLPYKITGKNGNIDLWDDKFLPMIEGHKGEKYCIISDGMCAEYTVFGINVTSDSDNGSGWDFVKLNIKDFDESEVISKYIELFDSKPKTDPELFIFSNYS